MAIIRHDNGRIYAYSPAGGIWGYVLGDAVPRFLMNCFEVHITRAIAEKVFFSGIVIGVAVGFFLSFFVKRKMDEYAEMHTTKEYVIRIIIEVIILSAIIIVGWLCIKYIDSKYGDFLYPIE